MKGKEKGIIGRGVLWRRKKEKRSKEGKRRREDDQEGICNRQEREKTLIKEDIEKRRGGGLWEGGEVFSRINHQGFLDSCSVWLFV